MLLFFCSNFHWHPRPSSSLKNSGWFTGFSLWGGNASLESQRLQAKWLKGWGKGSGQEVKSVFAYQLKKTTFGTVAGSSLPEKNLFLSFWFWKP